MEQIQKKRSIEQKFSLYVSRNFMLVVPVVIFVFMLSLESVAFAADGNSQGNKVSSGQKKSLNKKKEPLQSVSIPLPKASNRSKTGESSPASDRSPKSIWVTVTSLGLILVLIVLGAGLWKKHGPQVKNGLPQEAFQLLGKKTIDQKNSVFFFRTGSKILIVSSGIDGMRTLSEIVEPVEVDYLAGICKSSSGKAKLPSPFKAGLNKTLGGKSSVQNGFSEKDFENSPMEETPYRNG